MPDFSAHAGRGHADAPSAGAEPTAARSVTDIVDHLFARFDADGSGSITLSEWLGVVDPDADGGDRVDKAGAALMTLDTDADGAISGAEATTAVSALDSDQDGALSRTERGAARSTDGGVTGVDVLLGGAGRGAHGGDPGHTAAPVPIADAVTEVFKVFDSDGSGTLALSELVAVLGSRGHPDHPGGTEARLTAAVARLDSDADGALSAAELTTALTAADSDRDGSVGPGEAGPGSDVALVGVLLHVAHLPDIA